jgi:anti-sigma regulatory factor (Ser/Thr protein kinase)
VRQTVRHHAGRFGLTPAAAGDYVAAVHEIAANAVTHGGGTGTVRVWSDGDRLTTEIHDPGVIDMPPNFDRRPPATHADGRGLWLAHQLCDQVQIHSTPHTGTTTRLHTRRC